MSICEIKDVSECAKVVDDIWNNEGTKFSVFDSKYRKEMAKYTYDKEINTTYGEELEKTDKEDIWNWYFNQRGGSCNG